MRLGEILVHDGCLAQYRGDRLSPTEPVLETTLAVARGLKAEEYPDLVGEVPWSPPGSGNWGGIITTRHGGEIRLVIDQSWEFMTVREPVAKPRDGKTYTWEWKDWLAGPKWVKVWFPLCQDCGKQHRPSKACC
jgi:hypothetical protein